MVAAGSFEVAADAPGVARYRCDMQLTRRVGMNGEDRGPRDLTGLRVPVIGRVGRDASHVWQLFDAGGASVPVVRSFLADLAASDTADSTLRSYAYDLLRWFRFLAAVDIEWRVATRREVSDFVRWLRSADNAQRDKPSAFEPTNPVPAHRQAH